MEAQLSMRALAEVQCGAQTLPAQPVCQDVERINPASFGQSNHTVRVLVVDDNEVDREILARYLGRGWPFEQALELHFAENGREALELMRMTLYHMLFLDWHMPVAGGGEVLRALRGNGVCVPVVVTSGELREDIPFDMESLGAAFLNKDEMSPSILHDAVAGTRRSLHRIRLPRPPKGD